MTDQHTDQYEVAERLREVERRQHAQQRLMKFCLAGIAFLLVLALFPTLGGVLQVIAFSLSGVFVVLLIISLTMGLLEHVSPSGRFPDSQQNPPDSSESA